MKGIHADYYPTREGYYWARARGDCSKWQIYEVIGEVPFMTIRCLTSSCRKGPFDLIWGDEIEYPRKSA